MSENKHVAFDTELCAANPEAAADRIADLEQQLQRLKAVEVAVKRLAYIVRKSVNSGPLSKDPTQEAEAWRRVRIALGEGYDERGNLVPVSASNGR